MSTDPLVKDRSSGGSPRRGSPRNKLTLPRRRPLREALLDAFARVLGAARRAAACAASDPTRSVHDYRKAIRRARAVVALLRPSLGRTAADGITEELRRAFRETGARRDADILLATLRAIPSDDPGKAAIETALAEEREASSDPAETAKVLREGVAILRPLAGALGVTLPRAFSVDDLERGLSRGYRRVHRTLARAEETGLETDFHEWRKRVKELRYQLELLASTGSKQLKSREKRLSDLAEELGRVTDLIVLRAELEERQKNGGLPEAAALSATIRESILEKTRDLVARGKHHFAETPKEFARQVLAERG